MREVIKMALAQWNPARSGIGGPLVGAGGRTAIGDGESSENALRISTDLSISVSRSSSEELEISEGGTGTEETAGEHSDSTNNNDNTDISNLSTSKPPLSSQPVEVSVIGGVGRKGGAAMVKARASSLPRAPSWSSTGGDSRSLQGTGMEVEDPGWSRQIIPPAVVVPPGTGGWRAGTGDRQLDGGQPRRSSTGTMLLRMFRPALSSKELPPVRDDDSFDMGSGVSGGKNKASTPNATDDSAISTATITRNINNNHKDSGSLSPSIVIPLVPSTHGNPRTATFFQLPPAMPLCKAPRTTGVVTQPQPCILSSSRVAGSDDPSMKPTLATPPGGPLPPTAPKIRLPAREDLEMATLLVQTEEMIEVVKRRGRAPVSTAGVAANPEAGVQGREGGRSPSDVYDALTSAKRRAKSLPPLWPRDARRARRKRGGAVRPPRQKIESRPCMEGPTAVIENLTLDDGVVAGDGDAEEEGWGSGEWVSPGGEEAGSHGWEEESYEDSDGIVLPPKALHMRRATTTVV